MYVHTCVTHVYVYAYYIDSKVYYRNQISSGSFNTHHFRAIREIDIDSTCFKLIRQQPRRVCCVAVICHSRCKFLD